MKYTSIALEIFKDHLMADEKCLLYNIESKSNPQVSVKFHCKQRMILNKFKFKYLWIDFHP